MKVLIIKTSALGDIVHCYPVISYLKQRQAVQSIDWIAESRCSALITSHPDIRTVYPVDTKRWRKGIWTKEIRQEIKDFRKKLRTQEYDLAIDLQGNVKSALLLHCAKAKVKIGFSWKSVSEWPNILFTDERYNPEPRQNIRLDYLSLVQQHFRDLASFPLSAVELEISDDEREGLKQLLRSPALLEGIRVLVCPGSIWPNKQMSLSQLELFLKKLSDYIPASFLFAWGSNEEKEMASHLQLQFPDQSLLLEKLPLPHLQNLMSRVDLVIAMDSLPLHLAGTTSTPTFSVFGSSLAAKYAPPGSEHGAFQGSCPYGKTFEKRCPILRTCSTGSCIKTLDLEALLSQFELWWSQSIR